MASKAKIFELSMDYRSNLDIIEKYNINSLLYNHGKTVSSLKEPLHVLCLRMFPSDSTIHQKAEKFNNLLVDTTYKI